MERKLRIALEVKSNEDVVCIFAVLIEPVKNGRRR